eukprot:Tbor_TRINITY_DN6763_c0_g1::TRINITY_DN6763_c0_g1_i1::g.15349::m.15349/K02541/MCM3; DNA replication licensing factor MCM3
MLVGNQTLTSEQSHIRSHFIGFFENQQFERRYSERLNTMMRASKARLIIDMHDLLQYEVERWDVGQGLTDGDAPSLEPLGIGVMYRPAMYIPLCELAVHDIVMQKQADYLKVDYRTRPIHVGFEGPVGKVLGPREMYARHLNTLVALEGIITRQSGLRPRLIETVHYCPETNKFSKKGFHDNITPALDTSVPTVNTMPKTDMEGHLLRTELGLSSFLDSQCAMLQETPETSPTGQLPRSVELRLDDDLVDQVKAGDRVTVVGIFLPYTGADNKSFQSIVLVNHIVHVGSSSKTFNLAESEKAAMQRFCDRCQAATPNGVVHTLSKSIAPTVYGLTMEKQAILLMLVGGVERKAHDSHIRGDINILLVGEPSTAKSQLLRFVLNVAPLALNTTGKGSSGVGLTAAVTVDQYSGERSLSAGAMVLADRGVLCIDEFDKMSPQDRVSMHEAMEQQTVTVTKASIHATLNARCSVLAAANPVYGFYSVKHKLAFNVGLPETLLSRFDLSFIILDQHTSEHNRRIGTHILKNHMHATPVTFDTISVKTLVEREEHKPLEKESVTTNSSGETVPVVGFLKRYIQYARTFSPLMSQSAEAMVSQHYVQLRAEQEAGGKDGFFVTARTLESIIRLSTASAKLRLSSEVDDEDVRIAMSLVRASVHAATEATQQRVSERAAKNNVPSDIDRDDNNVNPHKRPREETIMGNMREHPSSDIAASATQAASGPSDSHTMGVPAATPDISLPSVLDALSSFRNEARQSIELYELRDRLGQLAGPSSSPPDLVALQRTVSQMDNDSFTFESTETADTVYFM